MSIGDGKAYFTSTFVFGSVDSNHPFSPSLFFQVGYTKVGGKLPRKRCEPAVRVELDPISQESNDTLTIMAANDWSTYAKSYSAGSVAQIPIFYANIAAQKLLESSSPGPVKFLDVAAGPGSLTERLLNLSAEKQISVESVTVTDFAEGMVESATDAIGALDIPSTIRKEFHVMDAQNMMFADNTFTHLGCMFGIMFFPDRPKGLSEICRVLQPGGTAAIGTWNFTDAVDIIPGFATYASLPDVVENVAAISHLVKICSDPAVFAEELRAVGFNDVTVHVHDQVFSLPNTLEIYLAFANNAVLKKALCGRDAMELYPKWQEYLEGPGKERWLNADGTVRLHYIGNIAIARK
jgi:ubiquinone/menaquinone biosynthesis C-methylase UbiE